MAARRAELRIVPALFLLSLAPPCHAAASCAETVGELRALLGDPAFPLQWHETTMKDGRPLELRRLVSRIQQDKLQRLLKAERELPRSHLRDQHVAACDCPAEVNPRMPLRCRRPSLWGRTATRRYRFVLAGSHDPGT